MVFLLAFLMGAVAGLRTMTAPTAVSWTAWTGRLDLTGSWTAFLGYAATPWVFTLMAIGELAADKHPATPSRKLLMGFTARIFSGALSGSAIGFHGGAPLIGAILGVTGAVVGTPGGAAVRKRLAEKIGKDWPAAVTEDIVAIGSAALIVGLMP